MPKTVLYFQIKIDFQLGRPRLEVANVGAMLPDSERHVGKTATNAF
jgi:hypothetical protein